MSLVTTSPREVGLRYFPSLATYSRPVMVLMVGAYVLGRPMPFSSMARISVASVYRAGGSVKRCSLSSFRSVTLSPAVRSGSGFFPPVSSSSFGSSYTAVYPGNRSEEWFALKQCPALRASITTLS